MTFSYPNTQKNGCNESSAWIQLRGPGDIGYNRVLCFLLLKKRAPFFTTRLWFKYLKLWQKFDISGAN